MTPILDQHGLTVAYLHLNIILNTEQDRVLGLVLGNCVYGATDSPVGKFFKDTFRNMREMPFAYFHVFSYSKRGHAKSRKLGDTVPKAEIERRSQKMRDLSNRKRWFFFEQNLGTTQQVLFEQKKNGLWSGLTDSYIRVNIESDLDLKNKFVPVKLESINGLTMHGRYERG